MFRPAEVSLARALKYLLDRALLACLDTIIQVFKVPAQPAAQGPAHTGLARAHEADQKDGAYFGWTCQSFCLRLPARPGLHVLIAHRSGRLTHRLAYFSAFLEVDFTTEGKQLDRRCGLVHGTCEGTPRLYGEGGVFWLKAEIVFDLASHRVGNYFDGSVIRSGSFDIAGVAGKAIFPSIAEVAVVADTAAGRVYLYKGTGYGVHYYFAAYGRNLNVSVMDVSSGDRTI